MPVVLRLDRAENIVLVVFVLLHRKRGVFIWVVVGLV